MDRRQAYCYVLVLEARKALKELSYFLRTPPPISNSAKCQTVLTHPPKRLFVLISTTKSRQSKIRFIVQVNNILQRRCFELKLFLKKEYSCTPSLPPPPTPTPPHPPIPHSNSTKCQTMHKHVKHTHTRTNTLPPLFVYFISI